MSTKRKNMDSEEGIHPSRQEHFETYNPKPSKKPRRVEPAQQMHKKQAHSSSVNTIKKHIRDITRRLERPDLPANVLADSERALSAFRQELHQASLEKQTQKMIKKYHMVRFFERQKATRLVKKLRKSLLSASNPEDVEKYTKALHVADVDVHYTQYSPLNEVYISLYRKDERDQTESDGSAGDKEPPLKRPDMWYEVERRMETGKLDQLRHGVRKEVEELVEKKKRNGPSKANAEPVGPRSQLSRSGSTQLPTSRTAKMEGKITEKSAKANGGSNGINISKEVYGPNGVRLNRREKRKEMRLGRNAAVFTKSQVTPAIQAEREDDGEISDGGFFEM